MISENKEKILRRAAERKKLRTRHVRSIRDWRDHVQELENMSLLVRLHCGIWQITPRGLDKLDELDESPDPQRTLEIARSR